MAMNNHHEARRKAMFLDRVCEARKRQAISKEEAEQAGLPFSGNEKIETVVCTDQGQFYQTSSRHPSPADMNNTVIFKKVVHDPNFYYRSSVERGEEPPLHVNRIYNVMYPGAVVKLPGKRQL